MLTESEREWLEEREKLREINGCYSYDFYLMQEEDSLLREGFWTTYQKYWSQSWRQTDAD